MINENVKAYDLEQIIRTVVREELIKLNTQTLNPPKYLRGIKELASYLGISKSKAQKLKNKNIVPYIQNERLVLFDPQEVNEALAKSSPHYN